MVRYHLQYTKYEVSIDSKVVCLWFTKSSVSVAELNLKLKPQANNIRISSNFTYNAISHPIDWIWCFNWFRGGFLMVLQELCFCGKNWMILQISTNPSLSDANLVITKPTIKIEIWSWKAKIDLIGMWHNGNLPQDTNTIGLSRMMPRSQLIFNKSDSVRSRTEEYKNHSQMLKLKNSEVIIIKAVKILAYMSLNSSWKINPNGPLMWTYMRPTQNWPKL
jgi:hypothetical protein